MSVDDEHIGSAEKRDEKGRERCRGKLRMKGLILLNFQEWHLCIGLFMKIFFLYFLITPFNYCECVVNNSCFSRS